MSYPDCETCGYKMSDAVSLAQNIGFPFKEGSHES